MRIEPPVDEVAEESSVPLGGTQPISDVEPATSGAVVSLTLGEVGDAEPLDDDVPSLDVPAEFTFPKHGAVAELDDLDIEEID
jgi:hypothetical protein